MPPTPAANRRRHPATRHILPRRAQPHQISPCIDNQCEHEATPHSRPPIHALSISPTSKQRTEHPNSDMRRESQISRSSNSNGRGGTMTLDDRHQTWEKYICSYKYDRHTPECRTRALRITGRSGSVTMNAMSTIAEAPGGVVRRRRGGLQTRPARISAGCIRHWPLLEHPRDALDLGAGTGKLHPTAGRMRAECGGGLPVRGNALQQLRAAALGVPARRKRGKVIPLQDGVVDAVLVAQAWHWVDPERAPREVARVLQARRPARSGLEPARRADGLAGRAWRDHEGRVPPRLPDEGRGPTVRERSNGSTPSGATDSPPSSSKISPPPAATSSGCRRRSGKRPRTGARARRTRLAARAPQGCRCRT